MTKTGSAWPRLSLAVIAAATLLVACADTAPVGPDRRATIPSSLSSNAFRAPDLGPCPQLAAPSDTKLAFHVYAKGVQIWRWTGTAWTLYGPDATLSSDAAGKSVVGTHYVGPTWETLSGSKVIGSVIDRCTPNAANVPWLLLGAEAEGPGVLHGVTRIQRVNTVGGIAPSSAGTFVGQEARIPYETEYFFYRKK